MQDSVPVAPVEATPEVVVPAEASRGQVLLFTFTALAEEVQKDTVKFFDKEQKAAARRLRKNLSSLIKFSRELRKEVSEIKMARLAAKS